MTDLALVVVFFLFGCWCGQAWTTRAIVHYLCGQRHRACDPCPPRQP